MTTILVGIALTIAAAVFSQFERIELQHGHFAYYMVNRGICIIYAPEPFDDLFRLSALDKPRLIDFFAAIPLVLPRTLLGMSRPAVYFQLPWWTVLLILSIAGAMVRRRGRISASRTFEVEQAITEKERQPH